MTPPFDPAGRPDFQDLTFQYQPIRVGASGEIYAFEALVRWALPDGTIRGPAEILPYYLSAQRIEAFTEFTIREAALVLARMPELRAVTINLGPDQLRLPRTARVLGGLSAAVRERLVIELTEDRSAQPGAVVRALEEIRGLGFRVLLDDVTPQDYQRRLGQAQLATGIKLDRSVLPALLDPSAFATRGFLLELLQPGFDVVVEGIEDRSAVAVLEDLGVRLFQGFGLGRPARSPLEHLAVAPAPSAELLPRPRDEAHSPGAVAELRRLSWGG